MPVPARATDGLRMNPGSYAPSPAEGLVASPGMAPRPRPAAKSPLCLCGSPMITDLDAGLWACSHCGRAFCRDCGGMMARAGGCDVCTICGAGACG